MNGVRVLKGAEVNIIDFDGRLDLEERYMKNLDFVLASLHDVCLYPGNRDENTRASLGLWKQVCGCHRALRKSGISYSHRGL